MIMGLGLQPRESQKSVILGKAEIQGQTDHSSTASESNVTRPRGKTPAKEGSRAAEGLPETRGQPLLHHNRVRKGLYVPSGFYYCIHGDLTGHS